MPKKDKWEKWLDQSWFWTKIFFISLAFAIATYFYGTFKPNSKAISIIKLEAETVLIDKIKALDLQEPSFEYVNEKQFLGAMHKCIDFLNLSTTLDKRVPYEMIIGQAALESGWGQSRFAKEGNNLLGLKPYHIYYHKE